MNIIHLLFFVWVSFFIFMLILSLLAIIAMYVIQIVHEFNLRSNDYNFILRFTIGTAGMVILLLWILL